MTTKDELEQKIRNVETLIGLLREIKEKNSHQEGLFEQQDRQDEITRNWRLRDHHIRKLDALNESLTT